MVDVGGDDCDLVGDSQGDADLVRLGAVQVAVVATQVVVGAVQVTVLVVVQGLPFLLQLGM